MTYLRIFVVVVLLTLLLLLLMFVSNGEFLIKNMTYVYKQHTHTHCVCFSLIYIIYLDCCCFFPYIVYRDI